MAAEQRPQEFHFDLSGGHIALDFANSVSRHDSPEKTVEHLNSYSDLVSFAAQSNLIGPHEAEALAHEANSQPRSASQVLRKALMLREAMFRAFMRIVAAKPAAVEDVALMEQAVTESLSHRHIVRTGDDYKWKWSDGPTLERILWPIATAAADLLVSRELHQLRECEAGDCYWLFLDNSRNHSRRWCTMSSCGNREKARRHYRRQRQS